MRNFMIGMLALALVGCGASEPKAKESLPKPAATGPDMKITVFTGGTIHTGINGASTADAIAIDAAGNILSLAPPASQDWSDDEVTLVDLNGGHLYPGFVDGHAHLLGIGQRELMFNLEGTASITELVTRLEAELEGREPGRPLYGRGWIETGWPEGRMPTAADLDAVSPDHPVVLERADGHAVVANTAALLAGGIDDATPDPEGGSIERDDTGKATGMLIDYAAAPVMALFKSLPTDSDIAEALEVGAQVYASRGWTGVHNMSVDEDGKRESTC